MLLDFRARQPIRLVRVQVIAAIRRVRARRFPPVFDLGDRWRRRRNEFLHHRRFNGPPLDLAFDHDRFWFWLGFHSNGLWFRLRRYKFRFRWLDDRHYWLRLGDWIGLRLFGNFLRDLATMTNRN